MPTRSRAAARNSDVADAEPTDSHISESLSRLKFNEPLSWRAGKSIALADLLRRLETLGKELEELEQEEDDDHTMFSGITKDLAAQSLVQHKDKGVRAWVAFCGVHLLRLCAPHAPFTGPQLKDLFSLVINSVVPALSDPSSAYNEQHVSVVQSLADVRSICLLTDLPSADSLIAALFASFFDLLSGSTRTTSGVQIGKNVEQYLTEILVVLVDEATSLPGDVIDTIVAQFLRADPSSLTAQGSKRRKDEAIDDKQSTFELKELPPAYNMAKTICNTCPEKMSRYISQYFNDVILGASKSTLPRSNHKSNRKSALSRDDWDSDDAPDGPSEEDLEDLSKTHKLLKELWRASPAVLQNVIPQLETELSAENVELRSLATETLGDMVSGIGAAGPPPPPSFDVAAFPPPSFSTPSQPGFSANILTTPASPRSFIQSHTAAYASFISRKIDKSPVIRAIWTTCIGRILTTSAGGVGLSQQEETDLVSSLSDKLIDSDERVRIAAIKSIATFDFRDVVIKLGPSGDVDTEDSVLSRLADRVKDRKHQVRLEAIKTLGQLWGVACGEIAKGNEIVTPILGPIPRRIFDAFYVNDQDINVMIDMATYELLLPLSYPQIKKKSKTVPNSQSGKKGAHVNGDSDPPADPDELRAQRSLLLAKGLDERTKAVFYTMQARQARWSKVFGAFLTRCSEYNGGESDPKSSVDLAKAKLAVGKLIEWFSSNVPEPHRISADLWKFAKANDRRSYSLLNYMMNPDSDYKTVNNALKEIKKRFADTSIAMNAAAYDSLLPIFYRIGLFSYNRSHVPAIVEISRTDKDGLGATAHEFLKEISVKTPEVFKSHVQELCRSLEDETPTAKRVNEPNAVDTLKACVGFAQKFPSELPQERKFKQSLKSFALYGSPPAAAKHAVTILMAATESSRSAEELAQKSIKDFKFGADHFLANLSTLAQLCLLAPSETEDHNDAMLDLVLKEVLGKVRTPSKKTDSAWVAEPELDEEIQAKLLGMKILVNRLRARTELADAKEIAPPVYKLLLALIVHDGELSKEKDTPPSQRARLRLQASLLFLKLCTYKTYDELLNASSFNYLASVSQDRSPEVRELFLHRLKKYLGQGRLPQRFYTIPFLLDSEPIESLRASTVTWLRSRALAFATQKSTTLEVTFARFLSLLAHHPDFSAEPSTLAGLASNLLFFLVPVARQENLGLIYHVAQRVKQVRDAIVPDKSENLYVLSDLAQALIRKWEEIHGWSMQTWPGKLRMPGSLFAVLPNHEVAQEIATKTYLPTGMNEELDSLVKAAARPKLKKRRSEVPVQESARKKARSSTGPTKGKDLALRRASKSKEPRTPKIRKDDHIPSSERRKSGRFAGKEVTYAESSDEENVEAEGWAEEEENEKSESAEEDDGDEEDGGEDQDEQEEPEAETEETGDTNDVEMQDDIEPVEEKTTKTKATTRKQPVSKAGAKVNGRSTRSTRSRG